MVDELAAVIETTGDPELAYGLTLQLSSVDCPRTMEVLKNIQESSPDPMLRYKSVQAMGALGGEASVEALLSTAQADPDKYNRARAVAALGEMKKKELIPHFRELHNREEDEFVKGVYTKVIEKLLAAE